MFLNEMFAHIDSNVDEQVEQTDSINWLNEAKNRLAMAVEAVIPDLDLTGDITVKKYDIPDRFHIILVYYACAKFKERESSLGEARNFMSQFEDTKRDFVAKYQVPPKYRDDRLAQNFVATDGQTDFSITKIGYAPEYNRLKVYVNDSPTTEYSLVDRTFKLNFPSLNGDFVTAIWEEHADFVEPPYPWMKSW